MLAVARRAERRVDRCWQWLGALSDARARRRLGGMGRLTAVRGRLTPAPSTASGGAPGLSASARGYGVRWESELRAFRRRHLLCLGCEAAGRVEATTVSDHVISHTHGSPRFWDQDWWQPACKWHHNVAAPTTVAR